MTLIATLCVCGTTPSLALIPSSDYVDGPETCRRFNAYSKEHPLYLQVPIDYRSPQSGTTPLYAWTHKPFDTSKPTAIFVSGGPGDTAHGTLLDLPDWNLVFFDQRGNSCSKPMTAALHRSRSFYSSENTARDINEIRKHLGIDQISLYGVSYGTIPAHLYGHLFPSHARAAVLEGVIYRSDSLFYEPELRRRLLQAYFNSLPRATRKRILELSRREDILPKNWFSVVGLTMMYMDDFTTPLGHFLNNVIWDDATAVATIRPFIREQLTETDFGSNEVMMGMIGCQELSMNTTGLSMHSVFVGEKLVSDGNNSHQRLFCRDLGFRPDEGNRTYRADLMPTHVPTTYFQGERDGATVLPAAIDHFKFARHGFGQLLIVKKGGHSPIHGPLVSGYEPAESVVIYRSLLTQALSGKPLDISALRGIRKVELRRSMSRR